MLLGLYLPAWAPASFQCAPNQTAHHRLGATEYRGYATGMVQTLFGVGSLLGISLAGVLLDRPLPVSLGKPRRAAGAGDPPAFVYSMNAVYVVCVALMRSRACWRRSCAGATRWRPPT